jgi:hypothetical protein
MMIINGASEGLFQLHLADRHTETAEELPLIDMGADLLT